jgi:ethanolaminephosphotransferase
MWVMTSFPFFLNTWEEYYTGELNLPIIHGVSEGTVMACTAMAVTGFFGNTIWFNKANLFFFEIQLNHLMTLSCFFAGIGFGLYSLFNVLKKYKEKRQDAIENLAIFITLLSTMVIVIRFSEHDSVLLQQYPKVLIILYGFAFAKLVGHLQVAHICDTKFLQYRKSLLTSFICLASVSLLNYYFNTKIVDIDYLILAFLFMHVVVWVHFAYYLSEEFCEILDIRRFSIQKRIIKKD